MRKILPQDSIVNRSPNTSEGNRSAVGEALSRLHRGFQNYLLLHDTDPLDVMLAALLSVSENDVPLWMMGVAPAGSGKTEMFTALEAAANVRMLSKVTPQTLISGWREAGARRPASLLIRLPAGTVLVVKDFTTILKLRPEARAEILSQLREVYDGALYASFGTGEDVHWKGKIGVLAGVTSIIDQFSPYQQMLGERFIMVRISPPPRGETARKALCNAGREREMKCALKEAVGEFLKAPRGSAADVIVLRGRQEQVIALADFVALGRTAAHRDSRNEIDALVEPEGPSRLARQFGLLSRMLAVVRGHEHVEESDIATTCRVGFDSLTLLRRELLSGLVEIDRGEGVMVAQMSERLRLPWSTTKHHLEDAASVRGGLVVPGAEGRWGLSMEAQALLTALHPHHP